MDALPSPLLYTRGAWYLIFEWGIDPILQSSGGTSGIKGKKIYILRLEEAVPYQKQGASSASAISLQSATYLRTQDKDF